MVVINRFYQISEKPTVNVPLHWKAVHLFLFVIAGITGLCATVFFVEALGYFNSQCLLDAQIIFSNTSFITVPNATFLHYNVGREFPDEEVRKVKAIDATLTLWGATTDCNFVQYTPIVGMISAIIWGTFFIISAKGGAGYQSDVLSAPWNLIYPCIIFCLLFSIILLSSTLILHMGMTNFCNGFTPELKNIGCVRVMDIYTLTYDEHLQHFYISYLLTMYCSYLGLVAWFGQLLVLLFRVFLAADFDIRLITISEKEEERVERVIEFHDDDDDSTVTSQV